jgi:inorganic triphosphatase YgiF
MRHSWAVSDAPGLETNLAFADPDDPLALVPVTPVAEASTWFAASLAALFVAWHGRRMLLRYRPAGVTHLISSLRRLTSRLSILHGAPGVSALVRGH